MRSSLSLGLVTLLVGCGGGSIELTATAAEDITANPVFVPASPSNRLVAIDVTLQNDVGQDIPLTTEAFRLDPVSGVSVRGAAITERLSNGCVTSAGAILPEGDTVSCTIAFEVAETFEPAVIAFTHEGYRAEDGVPPLMMGEFDAGPPDMDAGPPGGDAGRPDAGPPSGDAGRRDAGDPPPPTDQMDLLFLVDSSNSMVEEQASLAAQLPRLIDILTSGDADEDGDFYGDMEPGDLDFPPIAGLNVGVITPDMGTGGFTVPTCPNPDFGEDGVMRTEGNTSDATCMATYPRFLSYDAAGSQPPGQFAHDVSCVARVGTGGCGFEQQLEAVLKSVSPAAPIAGVSPFYSAPSFFRGTSGHGDGVNAGFLRPDSVLGLFVLTDEEDCSTADPDLFNPSSSTYTADLNLRCFAHAAEALHPIQRFVDGITQLREHPARIAYVLVAGIPGDLAPIPGQPIDWGPLISDDPAVRDDRLEERIDPTQPNRLVPSCDNPMTGLAFPPIRMLRVGRELELNGARVGIDSICKTDLSGAVDALVRATGLATRT